VRRGSSLSNALALRSTQATFSRRNFVLGVVNGGLWIFAMALIDPGTVMPAFALELTGSVFGVGLIAAALQAGWSWPPIFLTGLMERARSRMFYYHLSAAVRIVLMWIIVLVVAGARRGQMAYLWIVVALLLAMSSAGGLGLLPFMNVVSDTIPPRLRGRFFGLRYLSGGLLSLLGGGMVKHLLSPAAQATFPRNYVIIFATSAAVTTVALSLFSCVKEAPHPVRRHSLPLPVQLRWGWRLLCRDANYRLLTLATWLGGLAGGLVMPFLVPFALRTLRLPTQAVGLFLAASVLVGSLSNLVWSYLSDVRGNRRALVVSGACYVLVALAALAAYLLPTRPTGQWLGVPTSPALWWMLGVFALSGAAFAGQAISGTNYLLEICPRASRQTYLAFYYLVTTPLTLWPVAGAAVIGQQGRYGAGFAGAAVLSAAMLLVVLRLREVEW
jgi:MFS family permease